MMFLIPFNSYTLMFCLVNVEGLMQPFADLLHILICSWLAAASSITFAVHVPSKNEQIFLAVLGSFSRWQLVAWLERVWK